MNKDIMSRLVVSLALIAGILFVATALQQHQRIIVKHQSEWRLKPAMAGD